MFRCCTSIPEDWGDPDAFYPIKPDCREDVPVSHFKPTVSYSISFSLRSLHFFVFLLRAYVVFSSQMFLAL